MTLKELRLQNGLTQKCVADKLNIADKTYRRWESSHSTLTKARSREIYQLAKLFGVTVEYLIEELE